MINWLNGRFWGVDAVMGLLQVCLDDTYFQVYDRFYQWKEGTAVGNSLSPMVNNISIQYFEKLALDTTENNHSLWLRHSEVTFVIWSEGLESLQEFCNRINSLRPTIRFALEIESGSAITFLDVLLIR